MARRPDGCVRPSRLPSLRHPLGTALVALGACLATCWYAVPAAFAIESAAALAPVIAAAAFPHEAARLRDPAWLAQIYPSNGSGPVWFAPEGPRPAVASALRALRSAADRGLSPADYDAEALDRAIRATAGPDAGKEALARADVALTVNVLRLLSDLRFGRVRPQDVEPHYRAKAREASFVADLRAAVAHDRLDVLIDAAEPAFPVYARLKELLPRYRALATTPSPALPGLSGPRAKVVPGDRYPGVPALHDLLVRLGDLPRDAPRPADDRYDDALAAGVTRFQARHGLAQDGVLGRQTIAALNEPLATRVTQIELALERMRWLPEFAAGPAIAINVPSFQLWAFADARDTASATLSMPVIVGKAVQHETPIFIGEMRAVEFSPYWNVPRNILRNETLPRLARDPGYLGREDMELVSTRGDGRVLTSIDAASLEALHAGELRVRQRPGAKNALGGVKFVLPNAMEVYLHGTPARELFERTRRDFSHGCIRVQDPGALAAFVLRRKPEWTAAAIDAAMTSGRNRTVALDAPIPVVVFYTTAIVDAGGRAIFLPDVYGHDRRLLAAQRATRETGRQ
jgi:murein L,D-transpeptidase YcbB/YkuD